MGWRREKITVTATKNSTVSVAFILTANITTQKANGNVDRGHQTSKIKNWVNIDGQTGLTFIEWHKLTVLSLEAFWKIIQWVISSEKVLS